MALSFSTFADDEALSIHIACPAVSDECTETNFYGRLDERIIIKSKAEMFLLKSDISRAKMVKGKLKRDQLELKLTKEASKRFETITGENIGKKLVIIAKGEALIAPTIPQAINGGTIQITNGNGNDHNYIKYLPWLEQMVKKRK
jgi:preprotein translocase subunit SecD